ncbi:hypothetical protein FJZ31_42620 [Candidatus Poribacteria bacterium]|nr:hypothetical protein [Candidatus Poribacteria bacterium]
MFQKKALKTIITIIIVLLTVSIVIAGQGHEWKEKMISANGRDQITLSEGTKVIFPSKCLTEDTLVRVERFTIDSQRAEFYFEPHGLQFLKPVTIQLSWASLKNVTANDLILYYWNDEIGQWVEETQAIWRNNERYCELTINHFSYYYYQRR